MLTTLLLNKITVYYFIKSQVKKQLFCIVNKKKIPHHNAIEYLPYYNIKVTANHPNTMSGMLIKIKVGTHVSQI